MFNKIKPSEKQGIASDNTPRLPLFFRLFPSPKLGEGLGVRTRIKNRHSSSTIPVTIFVAQLF
jgi:hypothetical protein